MSDPHRADTIQFPIVRGILAEPILLDLTYLPYTGDTRCCGGMLKRTPRDWYKCLTFIGWLKWVSPGLSLQCWWSVSLPQVSLPHYYWLLTTACIYALGGYPWHQTETCVGGCSIGVVTYARIRSPTITLPPPHWNQCPHWDKVKKAGNEGWQGYSQTLSCWVAHSQETT